MKDAGYYVAQKKGAVSGMMGFSHIGTYRQGIFLLLFVVVVRHFLHRES